MEWKHWLVLKKDFATVTLGFSRKSSPPWSQLSSDKSGSNDYAKGAFEALDKQFIFHYPGLTSDMKKEGTVYNTNSRKRKATTGNLVPSLPEVPYMSNHEVLSMPLDEDDYVNYKKNILSI